MRQKILLLGSALNFTVWSTKINAFPIRCQNRILQIYLYTISVVKYLTTIASAKKWILQTTKNAPKIVHPNNTVVTANKIYFKK